MQIPERIIAPYDTLEGQLQRGRGEGFLRALDAPRSEVHELLLRCITRDPRWDTQLESRDGYYAELVQKTELDLHPLDLYLREHDDVDRNGCNAQLTVETLGILANRGRRDAANILKAYARYGQWWDGAIDCLLRSGNPDDLDGLDEAVSVRLPSEEALIEAMTWRSSDSLQWFRAFARPASRLTKTIELVLSSAATRLPRDDQAFEHQERGSYTALSTLELIRGANQLNWQRISIVLGRRNNPGDIELLLEGALSHERAVSATCLEALGLRRESRLLEILDRLLIEATPPWPRLSAMRALESLPAATVLPLARRWFFDEAWPLRVAAGRIFEKHATVEDVPMLRSAIPSAEQSEDYYLLSGIVEALALRADCGPFPELDSVFRTASYSYCRIRVVKLLAKSKARFASGFARECLWDCENQIRTIAVSEVDLESEGARDRIREIRDDPSPGEFDESAGAAKTRLPASP